jgi:hypothetical protein
MGNMIRTLYYSCKSKKHTPPLVKNTPPCLNTTNKINVSPSRDTPPKIKVVENIKNIDKTRAHKKNISDELDDVLEKYRITHPHTLIVDSPKYGLDKTRVLKNFGIN